MQKIALVAALAAFVAAPAYAASSTVEFTGADGRKQVWKFNDDGTAAGPEGATATYEWTAETKTLCGIIKWPDAEPQKSCLVFDTVKEPLAVGDTSTYTAEDGTKGSTVVVAVEE